MLLILLSGLKILFVYYLIRFLFWSLEFDILNVTIYIYISLVSKVHSQSISKCDNANAFANFHLWKIILKLSK